MKRYHILFFCALLSMPLYFFHAQEFVKSKEKKVYPSCQQCIELEGEIVNIVNKVLAQIIEVQKVVVDVQADSLTLINGYLEGDRECFMNKSSKHERADLYAKKMKKKKKLEKFLRDMDEQVCSLISCLKE